MTGAARVLAAVFALGGWCGADAALAQTQLEVDTSLRGSFSLVDHTGRSTTDEDFRSKLMLVFFGYTFCPDVCPIDLQVISQAMDKLADRAEQVQPLFVTVDPQRDTVEVMARHVRHFHPRLLGLTGSAEQVAAAAQAYGVISFRAPATSSDEGPAHYPVSHSAYTFLVGPDGRFVSAFDHDTAPGEMAEAITEHLDRLKM